MTFVQTPQVVVGIDLGSSSIKAAAYDVSGRVRAEARRRTPIHRGPHGLDFPVEVVIGVAREAVREAGAGARVLAVGIASMGEVGAVLRSDGRLSAAIFPAWYDARGTEVVADVRARLGDPQVWDGRTGGHLRTTSTLAKLGWLAALGDEDIEGRFLGLAGLLAHTWTGRSWQEASLACTSGGYDPVAARWLSEPWHAAGLRRIGLPVVTPAGHHEIAASPAATADGVGRAAIVIAGHDHPVAAVGTGAQPGSVVDSLGTGEAILAAWHGRSPSPQRALELVTAGLTIEVWPGSANPLLIGEGLRPGLALQTLVRASGMTHEELESSEQPVIRAEALSRRECETVEDGDKAPLLARTDSAGWPEVWRALLEAYARDAAAGETELRAATGAEGPLVVTGGGIRSATWLQAKRAATRAHMVVSSLADTGTRGAAAIAGASLGLWSTPAEMPWPDYRTETSVFR